MNKTTDIGFTVMSQQNLPIDVFILQWPMSVMTKSGDPGGKVIETIVTLDGKYYKGYAVCHPNDRFNFAFGAELSFKRALSILPRDEKYFKLLTVLIKKDFNHLWKAFLQEISKVK